LSQAASKMLSRQSMARKGIVCFSRRDRMFVISPKNYLYSKIIVTERAMKLLTEAIANHLVHEFRRQKICTSQPLHWTEFDYIHAYNRRAMTDFSKEVEQLIPM